ncbi:MAG TPA: VOC family protein [Longimicrobiales bacterium]|nr:VOC family protein [Longimicrobiales bacterium]
MDVPTFAALVPMLPVTNVPRTIAFYEQLGFTSGNTHTPEGLTEPVWAWLYCGQAHVMINQSEQPVQVDHSSAALWLYCEDVAVTHATLKSRGLDVGEVSYPVYNARGEFHVHDPDGYAIFVAHAD